MRVLGIHAFTHDSCAALVVDGRLHAFAQEERSSRIKGDGAFPAGAIASCLAQSGVAPGEVEEVRIPFRPGVGALRRLAYLARRPGTAAVRGFDLARKGIRVMRAESALAEIGIRAPVRRVDHYLAHALAGFCASPFEEAAVLVVDGVAEAWSGALFHGTRLPVPRIREVARLPFPHSLGLAYAAVTEHLGFRHNREEGKVMSMAALGDGRFDAQFSAAFRTGPFSLEVERGLFDFGGRWTTPLFHRTFGPPRGPSSPFLPEHFALARALQRAVEEVCLRLSADLLAASGCGNLCFTGGLALNPALNGSLAERSGCREFYAIPAGGDPGAALGAALLGAVDTSWRLEHAFWGRGCTVREVRGAVENSDAAACLEGGGCMERVAELLSEGAVGAVFRGRAEMGPRALGHRSILADPRSTECRRRLNGSIKRREPFQPFAPAVLGEACDRFFPGGRNSPFMLRTVRVAPGVAEAFPAVVHADGTARVQSVEEGDASGLSEILRAFERRTGAPVLLNTSLNRRGEPLADSPRDAVEIFRDGGLDFIWLEDLLLLRDGVA